MGKKLAQIQELERAFGDFLHDEVTVTRMDLDSVGRKEVQIQKLEQRLAAFLEEEKILEREKKELISYLEEEIDKGVPLYFATFPLALALLLADPTKKKL